MPQLISYYTSADHSDQPASSPRPRSPPALCRDDRKYITQGADIMQEYTGNEKFEGPTKFERQYIHIYTEIDHLSKIPEIIASQIVLIDHLLLVCQPLSFAYQHI
jgi:hypothetical protein